MASGDYIQEYKDNHKKKEIGWFTKTAQTAACLAGTAGIVYGAFKMKGPLYRLIDRRQQATMDRFFNKELNKYDFRSKDAIYETYKKAQMDTVRDMASEFETRVSEPSTEELSTSQSLRDMVDAKEKQIFDAYERGFAQNAELPAGQIQSKIQPPLSSTVRRQLAEDTLARVRQRTILEYFDKYSTKGRTTYEQALSDVDFFNTPGYFSGEEIKSIKNREIVDRTNALHDTLMRDSADYAALYNRRVNPISNRAKLLNAG